MEHRTLLFFTVLVVCLVAQQLWPRRSDALPKQQRWPHNLGLGLLGSLLSQLLIPGGMLAAALWADEQGLGLWHWLNLPLWLALPAALIALDVAIYWQHRLMHTWPWLWRLHRCHHSDLALDTTSGLRFHPAELLLSLLYKISVTIALGLPAQAVLLYEIILSNFALFNHSNWALPGDSWLRKLIVTPDMHRVHHSTVPAETNSNYGNFLSIWDKLFSSYIDQPQQGHGGMMLGLKQRQTAQQQTFKALLADPFHKD